MEKVIWVVGENRQDMITAQKLINASGSMRALCLLSTPAVQKALEKQEKKKEQGETQTSRISTPSLIILDYEMEQANDFQSLALLSSKESVAGVPLFFMMNDRTEEKAEICFQKGAIVVLDKPFSKTGLLRIERMAWQHEVTKNYEQMLQKQAHDLQTAREIVRLNEQLHSRNELLHQIFGRYFSEDVVDQILENPERAGLGGDKKEITLLLTDLRGFTSISEELETDELMDLLNYYFSMMIEEIMRYHGVIIEIMGDGILTIFGAPIDSDCQTEEALAAAISMQNKMGEVNKYCKKKHYPMLEMGIGIHRGEAFIGNVGSEQMMRYNVLGRVVNECSRIESASVGGQVLISDLALKQVKCPVHSTNELTIAAKGIETPIAVKEVDMIGGKFQKTIENVDFDVLVKPKQEIVISLATIEDKVINEHRVLATLKEISKKRAVVELLDFNESLSEFSDCFVEADGIFTNVYAKVVKRRFDYVLLHFTRTRDELLEYVESIR